MKIIVVFAGQRLRSDVETVKIAGQASGLFHTDGMGYAGFKKHATNFSGIGDGRLCAVVCRVLLRGGHAEFVVTHGNFFIFKTSGGPETFYNRRASARRKFSLLY